MIRFPCPYCGAMLRAPDDRVGSRAKCPDCERRSFVPTPPSRDPTPLPAAIAPPESPPLIELPSRLWQRWLHLLADMNPIARLALFIIGGLGLLCFGLMPFLGWGTDNPEGAGWTRHSLMLGGILSVLTCLAMLHGHGTSCPQCLRWWARKDTGNELAESDSHYLDGPEGKESGLEKTREVFRKVTYHYKHQCRYCGHCWITTFTEAYRGTVRRRRKADFDLDPRPEKKHRTSKKSS